LDSKQKSYFNSGLSPPSAIKHSMSNGRIDASPVFMYYVAYK